MMKRIFAVLILIISLGQVLSAQSSVELSGTVRDASGNPIVGAVAMFSGRDGLGAVTDVDGKWTLTVPQTKDSYIIFTCLGYAEEKIEIGDKRVFQTTMKEDSEIVTSHISDKYLQGILVGYIQDIKVDSSNMTKTAYLIPAVDFERLDEVLIVTELKEAYDFE
jgi:hypothetical protein